jgi:hypothetical protein
MHTFGCCSRSCSKLQVCNEGVGEKEGNTRTQETQSYLKATVEARHGGSLVPSERQPGHDRTLGPRAHADKRRHLRHQRQRAWPGGKLRYQQRARNTDMVA